MSNKLTLTLICDAVAAAYEISLEELFSSGDTDMVLPRMIAAHLCVDLGSFHPRAVAQFMQTEQTNVNRWAAWVVNRAGEDEDLAVTLAAIRQTLLTLKSTNRLREGSDIDVSTVMQRAMMPGPRSASAITTQEVRALASHASQMEVALTLAADTFRDGTSTAAHASTMLRMELITLGFLKDETHDASH